MAAHVGRPNAILSTSHFLVSADGSANVPAVHPAWTSDHPDCVPTIPLELTARIGIPILCCSYKPAPSSATAQPDVDPKMIDSPNNPVLHTLSISKEPGGVMRRCQVHAIPRPTMLLIRADGMELRAEHVTGLYTFVDGVQRSMPSEEAFLSEMTRENFIKFWNEHPVYKLCEGGCPVPMQLTESDPLGYVACTPQDHRIEAGEQKFHLPALFPAFLPSYSPRMQDFPLPITARIGLPLYFSFAATDPRADKRADDVKLLDIPYNSVLRHFTICRASNGLMEHRQDTQHPRATILLRRADGKELTVSQVMMLWIFIADGVHKMQDPTRPEVSHFMDYDTFIVGMTPEKFVERWEKGGEAEWDKGNTLAWARGECPVKLGCKTCGKIDGVQLMKCGKCGMVKYCGRECQKEGWAAHKKLCRHWDMPRNQADMTKRSWMGVT